MLRTIYERAAALLEQRLRASALRHSLATAEQAAHLATVYGVDPELARLAGLLHDWSREEGDERLTQAAQDSGVELTEVDRVVPYLLHGQVGAAAAAKALPDLPGEVAHAISLHTMGARVMTDLDMVVYLADILEPGRRHPGLDELRELVGVVPLRELYAEAYAASIRHLVSSRKYIHPTTVEAWNAIVAGESE